MRTFEELFCVSHLDFNKFKTLNTPFKIYNKVVNLVYDKNASNVVRIKETIKNYLR